MFCKHCGQEIADGAKFCPSCGTPVAPKARPESAGQHETQSQTSYTNSGSGAANTMHYTNYTQTTAPAPKMRKTFTAGNFVTWAGCVLAFISLFLTFATVSVLGFSQSVVLIDAEDGKLFLIVILAVAVINFFRVDIVTLIGSAVGIFFLYLEYKDAADKLQQFSSMVHYGSGRTLLTIGILLMILGAAGSMVIRKNGGNLNFTKPQNRPQNGQQNGQQ